MNGNSESQVLLPTLYSNLTQTAEVSGNIEKTLYSDSVAANASNYTKSLD